MVKKKKKRFCSYWWQSERIVQEATVLGSPGYIPKGNVDVTFQLGKAANSKFILKKYFYFPMHVLSNKYICESQVSWWQKHVDYRVLNLFDYYYSKWLVARTGILVINAYQISEKLEMCI